MRKRGNSGDEHKLEPWMWFSIQGLVSEEVCSRDVALVRFWLGRGREISQVDNNAIFKTRDGLVLGLEGGREVGGVIDWRGEEWTIACEFVVCVKLFGENTIVFPLTGERAQIFDYYFQCDWNHCQINLWHH